MNKIKSIIIEDEKPAQEVLASFISRVNSCELAAAFENALEALDYLKIHKTDLIFLDIQIPSLSGIDFLKILKDPPQVIITSAYSQYALEAFDLDVRDYLIKPFSFERFLKAIGRVTFPPEATNIYQLDDLIRSPREDAFAFFNMNKNKIKVRFNEILFVESMGEYVCIHVADNKVITKLSMGEMEKILGKDFLRTHRSFIVSIDKVTAFNAEEVFVEKKSIPIGGNYKKLVQAVFEGRIIR